jgi:SAM-dependent methyltransferase
LSTLAPPSNDAVRGIVVLDSPVAAPSVLESRALLGAYTLAIFTSALLLFMVQPMFSKMVLPLLGGTPAVWNTCMLFFQTALLAGYLYAHLSTRWLGIRRQAVLHLVILAAALLTLPITISERWASPSAAYPTLWLLALLTASLGLPFFILSSSGPLFQKWFSYTGHREAHNPYFLYAASNLGSMLALLSYPVLVEPRLRLAEQTWLWTVGFGVLLALAAVCAGLLWRGHRLHAAAGAGGGAAVERGAETTAHAQEGITGRRRLRWVLLAFAASSLLLGVTTYITTDIAAVPLLWVIPLALYLLTFILVFARRQLFPHWLAVRVQPFLVIPLVLLLFWGVKAGATPLFLLHLAAFFVTVLVCHGELARDRPPVRYLTEFYLLISVGGALGGVFNTLVAPHLFDTIAEYPLILVLACLLRPALAPEPHTRQQRRLDLLLPAAIGVAAGAAVFGQARELFSTSLTVLLVVSIPLALLCLSFNERPLRFGLGLGALLLVGLGLRPGLDEVIFRDRTFFGTHAVAVREGGSVHALMHGTTLHGTQLRDPSRRLEITTYYHREGPVGQIFAVLHGRAPSNRVGVVGLGTGSIACYGRDGEAWTYFEIDPVVERIARDPRYFTFLRDCAPEVDVVLGDARLTLGHQPQGEFDLLIIDAFSSDAIPLHLLTREAVALYLEKLAPGGVLAFHVSNRHLDLEPVLASLQHSLGVTALYTRHNPERSDTGGPVVASPSAWSVFARSSGDLGELLADGKWRAPAAKFGFRVWTDDFANILSIYKWR